MADTGNINNENQNKSEPWKTPAFIKNSDLDSKISGYTLCVAIEKVIGEYQLESLQLVGGVWRAYLLKTELKAVLTTQGIELDGKKITVHSSNPMFVRNNQGFKPNGYNPDFFARREYKKKVKVLIKGVLRSVANSQIRYMFKSQFGIEITSDDHIMMSNYRDDDGNLIHVKNCDRYCYIEEDLLKVPLPREAKVGNRVCQIFHEGQYGQRKKECYKCFSSDHFGKNCRNEACCKICRSPGHTPGSKECNFYHENDGLCTFGGGDENDFLSNHYPCRFVHNHVPVDSSEVAWFYRKAMLNFQPDLAREILASKDAKHAKKLGKRIRCALDWDTSPLGKKVMEEVLLDKFTQVEECNTYLRETHAKKLKLVEAIPTADTVWGSGLGKTETINTEMSKWPGQNQLGGILENVRSHLFDEGWSDDEESDEDKAHEPDPQNVKMVPNDLPSPPQGGEVESTESEGESTQKDDPKDTVEQPTKSLDSSEKMSEKNEKEICDAVKNNALDRVLLKASKSPSRGRTNSPKRSSSPRSKSIKRSQHGSSPLPAKQSKQLNENTEKIAKSQNVKINEGRKVSSETGVS